MCTDTHLARRVRNGEDLAFEELCARYADMIGAKAARYGSRGESADDFRQAALFGLYEAACSFRPGGAPFSAYANAVIGRALIDFLKRACRLKHQVLDDSSRFEQTVTTPASESIQLAELVTGMAVDDPCEIAIAREEFAEQLGVLAGCAAKERAAVAWRLNGGRYEKPNGRHSKQEKQHDNALQRVRAKLKAAA